MRRKPELLISRLRCRKILIVFRQIFRLNLYFFLYIDEIRDDLWYHIIIFYTINNFLQLLKEIYMYIFFSIIWRLVRFFSILKRVFSQNGNNMFTWVLFSKLKIRIIMLISVLSCYKFIIGIVCEQWRTVRSLTIFNDSPIALVRPLCDLQAHKPNKKII